VTEAQQTPASLRILVVDDEESTRRMLRTSLAADGHTVVETDRGAGALDAVRRGETDLIVLDLGLPDFNGLQVIKRIRYAQSKVPVIVLSNHGDETSKVTALDLGADDYVTKPFSAEELLARIRVLQRHRIQPPGDPTELRVGELAINLMRRTVTVRGEEIRLSPREYDLLRLFVTHAGKVLTHGFVLRRVWGENIDIQYVRIYVRALRQKLELDPEHPTLILTEPGVGYRLNVADKVANFSAA
jgi:two-component system, OmpR family, KDP operon response regulator KdpE